MTDTKFGQRFSGIQTFHDETVSLLGIDVIKRESMRDFRKLAERNREVILLFEHTVEQLTLDEFWRGRVAVRTQAIALRAQLAIEGPKESK